MCMHAHMPQECVEGGAKKILWRLMRWIHGCDSSSQPAARTAATPAGCIDWKGRGQITYTPGRKTQTHTCTHCLCVSTRAYLFVSFCHLHLKPCVPPPSPAVHRPPTGLITPSFGMKGNGSASIPRGPVPARPLPQPHPKDEDTLVQMAEHIPAGMRTPMCAHCNMVIRWGPNTFINLTLTEESLHAIWHN